MSTDYNTAGLGTGKKGKRSASAEIHCLYRSNRCEVIENEIHSLTNKLLFNQCDGTKLMGRIVGA